MTSLNQSPATSTYVALWQVNFALALLLEVPWVVALSRRSMRLRAGISSLIGNCLTHPILWFALPRVLSPIAALWVGEGLAIAIEACVLWLFVRGRWTHTLAISAAVNIYSWTVGEFLVRMWAPKLWDFYFS